MTAPAEQPQPDRDPGPDASSAGASSVEREGDPGMQGSAAGPVSDRGAQGSAAGSGSDRGAQGSPAGSGSDRGSQGSPAGSGSDRGSQGSPAGSGSDRGAHGSPAESGRQRGRQASSEGDRRPDVDVSAPGGRAGRGRTVLGLLWAAAVVVGIAVALAARWEEVGARLGDLRLGPALGAFVLAAMGVGASGQVWRSLLAGTGSSLPLRPAVRVFFVGQLGKYLPGSVWPVLAQAELGRDHGVPRRSSVAAQTLFMWVHLVSGAAVAALLLPVAGAAPGWVALAVAPCAALLMPGLLGRTVDAALRLARRQPLPARPGRGAVVRSVGWSAAMWVTYGLHVVLLGEALCAGSDCAVIGPALGTGAFAAAWTAGFVLLIAPAGAGVREAVLVALLAGTYGGDPAFAVALVSRLVMTAADGLWGAAGLLWLRPRGPASG